ncbi:protein DEHYDRATION-INDUCED 19 homolog 4-like isoform X3 [Lycium barbarum]|uniref:protein DEHYDRATION-INDUCED 19 homolog 4-like isoform X3 n=1 Tax=Lycium barbarum TaxID=112863 RepID=UPI00293F29C9|nr:protein DEHYDRATION-INDUCED 19 homolog 4-like isoform X3 [Lycium barbarum]
MDSDFWNNHISTAKRHFNLQHHNSQFDRLSIDDFEVEEEARPDFPCPYCYEDFDIASLCSHIEDEHSCESKATVCPICSVKVVSDLLSHITLQHGHLLKVQRRRRLRKVAIPSSQALSLLEDISKSVMSCIDDSTTKNATSQQIWKLSFDPSLSSEEREKRIRRATGRASFVQDLFAYTLLAD